MAILIKDIEMPKCCGDCWALDESGDYPECLITQEQRGYDFNISEKKMDRCPLADVKEQRHAEWLHEQLALPLSDGSKECVRCSSCLTHWDNESNYCPNCGADMRGEKTSAPIRKTNEKKKTDEILSDTPNHPEVKAYDEDWANDWMSG